MDIIYKDTHEFESGELERLFLSVNWKSGKYPDKLVEAMRGYKTVYSAWDGDKLVGLVSAMDDGAMTAYVHYLLVDPQYHNCGIGKTLLEAVKAHYSDYLKIVLEAYNEAVCFYEKSGFAVSNDSVHMSISRM